LDGDGSPGHVRRLERQCGIAVVGLDSPPDGVAAVQATRGCREIAKGAVEAAPSGECRLAISPGVLVMEEVERHCREPARGAARIHQGRHLNRTPRPEAARSQGGCRFEQADGWTPTGTRSGRNGDERGGAVNQSRRRTSARIGDAVVPVSETAAAVY